jgi:molybdate transport system substrate-binding protein
MRTAIAFYTVMLAALLSPITATGQERSARPKLSDAHPGDIRVFVSGALRPPLETVRPALEKQLGHPILIEVSESRVLQQEIEGGQPFEAALLTSDVIDGMIAKGKVARGSKITLSTVRLGVAARGDVAGLDIGTAASLKKAILGAASVRRFYGLGASVPMMDNLFAKLDIADALKGRIVPLGTGSPAPETALAPGQYALILNLASEVMPMKGWTYLGLVPDEFQMPIQMSAGIGTAGDAKPAAAFLKLLKGPEFSAAMKADALMLP